MSRYITVVYDTEKWNKNQLEEIYNLPSVSKMYYGDAITEIQIIENELNTIKESYEV